MVNKSEEQNEQNDQEKKTILKNKYFSIQNIITMVTNRFLLGLCKYSKLHNRLMNLYMNRTIS